MFTTQRFDVPSTEPPPIEAGDHTISPRRIEELSALDPIQRTELVALFTHEARRLQSDLESAVAAKQRDGIRAAAHAVKGMCLNFGANGVAALARRLEIGALRDDFADMARCAKEIGEGLGHATAALNRTWEPARNNADTQPLRTYSTNA